MALRRNRSSAEQPETPPAKRSARTAEPSRELIALTPRTGLLASAASTGAFLGTAGGLGLHAAAGAAAATGVVTAIGGKVRGRTLGQWIALRLAQRDIPEQAALFSRDGVGVVFDGRTVTALVEITPRPWQVTRVGPTGFSEAPVISAEVLRCQLHQFGIDLSRIDVISVGYKFAIRDNAAGVLDTLIGPVSVPLGGTTVLAVSIDLDAGILSSAYARARRESLPDGMCQTLTVAATRVCYSLAEQGFGSRLMSAQQIRGFHDEVLTQVSRPLAEPRWRNCGATSGVHTRTYVPRRGHWNVDSAASWNHLQSHRQYTTLTLTPQGDALALAQPLITYLVRDGDALSKAASYGLSVAGGQQVQGLSRALPCAAQLPLRSTGVLIDESRSLGFGIAAGGAGLFVGSQEDKTRIFVAVSPAEEPLWLAGPELFALQMVARLSTQDQRISVMIDEPRWQHLVAHRDAPALSLGDVDSAPAGVVVCTPAWWERHRSLTAGKAVVLVTGEAPGRGATNSLVVDTSRGRSEIVVTADAQVTRVLWELTPIERRVLLGDDIEAGGSPAAPIEGVDLRLADVVALPGARPRVSVNRSRQAPAPVVDTVGQATPDTTAPPPRQRRMPRPAEPVRQVTPLLAPTEAPQLPPMTGPRPLRPADKSARRSDQQAPPKPPRLPDLPPPVVLPEGDVTPAPPPPPPRGRARPDRLPGRHHRTDRGTA